MIAEIKRGSFINVIEFATRNRCSAGKQKEELTSRVKELSPGIKIPQKQRKKNEWPEEVTEPTDDTKLEIEEAIEESEPKRKKKYKCRVCTLVKVPDKGLVCPGCEHLLKPHPISPQDKILLADIAQKPKDKPRSTSIIEPTLSNEDTCEFCYENKVIEGEDSCEICKAGFDLLKAPEQDEVTRT